ncbi:hypothetical protein DPMN_084759 [Dreissena polymorpha]|uniref:Uncharacterized protein n=1 Tax=Dreissena polymorpha TaxID=45954 RepID=A0A9D4BJK0_DREPO|nr:hypothetical protein DPMN_084759 [Dreissena polymorpha]
MNFSITQVSTRHPQGQTRHQHEFNTAPTKTVATELRSFTDQHGRTTEGPRSTRTNMSSKEHSRIFTTTTQKNTRQRYGPNTTCPDGQ